MSKIPKNLQKLRKKQKNQFDISKLIYTDPDFRYYEEVFKFKTEREAFKKNPKLKTHNLAMEISALLSADATGYSHFSDLYDNAKTKTLYNFAKKHYDTYSYEESSDDYEESSSSDNNEASIEDQFNLLIKKIKKHFPEIGTKTKLSEVDQESFVNDLTNPLENKSGIEDFDRSYHQLAIKEGFANSVRDYSANNLDSLEKNDKVKEFFNSAEKAGFEGSIVDFLKYLSRDEYFLNFIEDQITRYRG